MVGRPVVREQPSQLLEGGEVLAVGQRAQAAGVPGPREDRPAALGVGREGGQRQRVSAAGVAAGGLDGRGDQGERMRPG